MRRIKHCVHNGTLRRTLCEEHNAKYAVQWCARCGAIRRGAINNKGRFVEYEKWVYPWDMTLKEAQ